MNITKQELDDLLQYDPESGEFYWKKARRKGHKISEPAGSVKRTGYREIMVNYVSYGAHRLVMLTLNGELPSGPVDHINCNKLDNRADNLRLVTRQQNQWNRGMCKNNTSGFKGVSWNHRSKLWQATSSLNFKSVNIGSFKTAEEADIAMRVFREKHHGEYARHA